jgi:hypothetical protein
MTISDLRKSLGQSLGFGSIFGAFDGSPGAYADLSPEDQVRLTNAMTEFIRQNPSEFTPSQVRTAQQAGVIENPVDYSAGSALSDFMSEAASQASGINDAVNPFSEANRNKLLWLGVAGVAVYVLAPVIIKAIREGRAPVATQ